MRNPNRMNVGCRIVLGCLLGLSLLSLTPTQAATFFYNIPGPADSGVFGETVTVLPNGNFVVTDPYYPSVSENTYANFGAVYLYSPNGVLISTLTGDYYTNSVGSGGITVLANGNYVVSSPFWDAGIAYSQNGVGAVTWCSQVTGCDGTVSASNSLIGSNHSDLIGSGGVIALANGNYVVISPGWDNGSIFDTGAVTWGNGANGTVGVVSASNSLVGSQQNDMGGSISDTDVFTLTNGNYLVLNPSWDNGGVIDAGAITWGNGASGTVGVISAANSLVGNFEDDQIGDTFWGSLIELANGSYVVNSPNWDLDGTHSDVGAVTWGSGTSGVSGPVSAANSLVGDSSNSPVGDRFSDTFGVIALSNGNYVVGSPYWDLDGSHQNVGAATWGSGTSGVKGSLSASNSLVGSQPGDYVGDEVIALSNGNYVVSSPDWSLDESHPNVGAVTWGDGTSGIIGTISSSNSLLGDDLQSAGGGGVIALTNGNYVVSTPAWCNEALDLLNVGAITWGDGTIGTAGIVSTTNSLVGDFTYASVGSGGLVALTNGNYVAISSSWNDVGAVTWGDGSHVNTGVVSTSNSLVGSTGDDQVGSGLYGGGVIALTNGNYVVISPYWDNGSIVDAGAVTWGNGLGGTAGEVSTANSLVGSTADDQVGGDWWDGSVTGLTNGNYVVSIPQWDNGSLVDVGAVTWGNGLGGTVGVVSPSNSLVGSTTNDMVGNGSFFGAAGVTGLTNGDYVINSSDWSTITEVGAFTWGNGNGGTTGAVSASNSLVNSCLNDDYCGSSLTPFSDGNASLHLSGWNDGSSNYGAVTLIACTPDVTVGQVSSANSILGSAPTGGNSMVSDYDPTHTQLIVGRPKDNRVTILRCLPAPTDWVYLPAIVK
jgi:hypothetical protein